MIRYLPCLALLDEKRGVCCGVVRIYYRLDLKSGLRACWSLPRSRRGHRCVHLPPTVTVQIRSLVLLRRVVMLLLDGLPKRLAIAAAASLHEIKINV